MNYVALSHSEYRVFFAQHDGHLIDGLATAVPLEAEQTYERFQFRQRRIDTDTLVGLVAHRVLVRARLVRFERLMGGTRVLRIREHNHLSDLLRERTEAIWQHPFLHDVR